MSKSKKNVTKLLFSVIITTILLLAGSCQNWMSSDDFMSKIESEVHDANATEVNVYVRYANQTMGTTEPSGNTKMKVDVASKISAITNDDYGFVKWAAFTTKDFPTGKQHSSLIFVTEADYNENYKKKELPDTLVHFDNPTSPTTEVKIFTSQNDIFIIPIVAERPGKKGSFPKDTSENNVKNTSITVYFSKAIKEDSLKNTNEDSSEESGKNVNFSITSMSFNSYLAGDTSNIEEEDITDYFTYELDSSGTILTFTLKEGKLLGSNQTITVTLYEDICDRDGFKMKGNSIFTFDTGTQSDNLAPIIEVLLGGRGDTRLGDFVSFHNDDEIKGSATEAAEKAPKNINDEVYTSSLIAQRVSDKLYIYVKAVDIIGAGANAPETANTLKEENVRYIGVRASLYIENKDDKGVPLTKNREELVESIKKNNILYIPDNIDEKTDTSGLFSELFQDIVPLEDKDKEDSAYTGGEIFSYDVSNLPDGLIKIDVWGMDKNNNSGDDFSKGATYYKNHDNGYKSIFVVKDTTAPDSATEARKLQTNSEDAPYAWYNKNTLESMQLFDDASSETTKIVDAGHSKLRSLAENLSWSFVVGKVTNAPAANDKSWKLIHDADTGASLKYDLHGFDIPKKDGPVDITLFIKDDLGNVSKPVFLDSIMYDNTRPTVTLKSAYGDFVENNGDLAQHNSFEKVIHQILKVNYTEPNVDDAGSGLRRLEIHVKKDNKEVKIPLAKDFQVRWSTAADATPATAEPIKIAKNDKASTNNLIVFDVNDESKITTGTLFIYGITLGDDDGKYTVSVDLYDSAMNKTTKTANTLIARDTTAPVIEKVKILGAKARTVYGQTEKTWWLPKDLFQGNELNKASFQIIADESGSGLKSIAVSKDIEFTAATKLKCGSNYLDPVKDYELDATNNIITLLDHYDAKLINDPENNSSIEITLENVKLKNIDKAAGNKPAITIEDFVNNEKSNLVDGTSGDTAQYTVYYPDGTTGNLIFADNTPPAITKLQIKDTAQNTENNPDNIAYNKIENAYTDYQLVELTLTLTAESTSNGSGVEVVRLSDNALFTNGTTIFVDGTELPSNEYTIANDKKSVKFTNVFTAANVLKFTDVKIDSSEQGKQTIKAGLTDFVGHNTTVSTTSNNLTYDTIDPEVTNVEWLADDVTVTAGNTNSNIVNNQKLKVEFIEATAGTKIIKFDITTKDSTSSYATPFAYDNLEIKYNDVVTLVKGTDYTVESNGRYIVLNKTYTSGSFTFHGLKLKDVADEALYTVKVTLLDAAENTGNKAEVISIDTTKPEISENLLIPELKETTELTTAGTTSAYDGHWLSKGQVNGNSKAPDKIPVTITIKESNSGVKVIQFTNDAVLSNNTKLNIIDENGDVQPVTAEYTVNTEENTITIKNKTDANELFAKKDSQGNPVAFKLVVENVGFKNVDTDAKASINTIEVKVSDVAMNVSEPKSTQQARILSDSIAPAKPQNLKLVDRAEPEGTIKASAGYTNDSIINMTFDLPASEKFGSGYHKFVLTGAKFIKTGTDATEVIMKSGSSSIQNLEWDISNDGRTLTLKKTGQNANVYAVLRQAVSVTVKNIQLDNSTTEDIEDKNHPVTLKAYDLVGWNSTAATANIILDTSAPSLAKDPFTAAYTYPSTNAYYNPAVNVYPHANTVGVKRELVSGKTIPVFYTATSYEKEGVTQSNGVISVASGHQYGAVIGISAKDNRTLLGYERTSQNYLYYDTDENFTKTKVEILTANKQKAPESGALGSGSNTVTASTLNFGFPCGRYSAVIVDEAGNCSDVFHFAIVKDITKPAFKDSEGNVTQEFNDRVLIQRSSKTDVYRSINYNSGSQVFDFKAVGAEDSGFRTKKYLTNNPGNSNKHKIILNLGGSYTSNLITKINGDASTTTDSFEELTATDTSSPIEQYAISTWYGDWPRSNTSTEKYQPVVPYGTYFPSGQQHVASASSDTTIEMARLYFNITNNSSSYLLAPEGKTSWHTYSHPLNADGTKVTDSGNKIVSYVDKNNNLVIEIPNTQSTAPISVFLRDGCGNMDYIVLGLEKDSGNEIAVSYILDDSFGAAELDGEGHVVTPVIVQNPHMTYPATTSDAYTEPVKNSGDTARKWDWNKQGGNANKSGNDGVGQTRGFIKDYVKYVTYYNPAIPTSNTTSIDYTDIKNQMKLGLTLQNHNEEILFTDDLGITTDKVNYTCRAILYCTTENSVPDFATATAGKTDDDWTYARFSASDTQLTIQMDYPRPDYTTPYYIWYVYQDRVGNYEIGKVVNSSAKASTLNSVTEENSTVFDKWLYDNQAPVITINGTSTDPSTITADNISTLVPENNDFAPYVKDNGDGTSTVYIHASKTHASLQTGASLNETIGYGTTHDVDNHKEYSIYNNFVNLEVSELTGVRTFAWTTSENYGYYDSYSDGSGWYTGSTSYWYVGWGSVSGTGGLAKDIGNGEFGYSSKPENAYYGSGTVYEGKYSGTKVCTTIPYGKTTYATELWLHVMDWTGNISHYRMGENIKFVNDSAAPGYKSDAKAGVVQPDQYYIIKDEDSYPTVRIAGIGSYATSNSDIKLYIPTDYFSETGAGIRGYSFNGNGIQYADFDENGPYLNLTRSDYYYSDTVSHSKMYWVYDNVGNRTSKYLDLIYDTDAPQIVSVSLVIKSSSNSQEESDHVNKFCDIENGLESYSSNPHKDWGFDCYRDYQAKKHGNETQQYRKYHAKLSDVPEDIIQEIYLNKKDVARFHVNLKEATSDIKDVIINKWNDSEDEWELKTSYTENNGTSWFFDSGVSSISEAVTIKMGEDNETGFTLDYTPEGVYYQILAVDISGNTSCQYFKLYLDNQGPELVARTGSNSNTPTIELGKGSINKITSNEIDTYYYTADSTHKATIKFAMTDAGMKNSKQKFYYSFDNSTWKTINNPTDISTEVDALVESGNLDQIYLKDIFGNPSTIDVNFSYTYGSNITTEISALTYWNTKPATPTFKVYANDATILTTDNFSGNDGWSAWNTSLLEDSTDTIAINGKSLKWAKISFAKSDKIIGYLVTDGEGNLIKEAEYGKAKQYGQTIYVQNIKDTYLSDEYKKAVGSYSFKTDLKDTFTETLPLLKGNGVNTSYAQATRKYYAVDVVGNISDALTLTYSYSNPSHQATDIHLIRNLDEIEASDVKTTITAAVNNGTLKLAQIADSVVGTTTTTRYFSGDYLLLSCTLKAKASNTNDDTPAKVELVDIWGGAAAGSAVRGYAQGDNIILYPSNQKNNDDRYYCYVAFKVDAFDNNDQYGGSQLYLRVYGKPSQSNPKGTESDSFLINPANEINIRWKRDTSAPVIKSAYIDESRLKGYKTSGDVTIGYDNKTDTNGMTNYYSRGMYIYLPIADITDGITYTGNDNNDIGLHSNDFITYAGTAQYKTIVTGGASDVDSGWENFGSDTISWDNTDTPCYKIAMPNVETVHSEITLKIRDAVGNESSGIKIGESNEVDSLWWLVDDLLTKTGAQTTITAPTVEWPNPTELTGYTFDVTPPVGSIIKSITATLPGSDTNLVSNISFKEYKSQPSMNGSNGWINISGLEVTLNKIPQIWSPQDVEFTINGVAENSTVTKTVSGFVPAKKISTSDITLTQATWNSSGTAETEYDVGITMNGGDNAPSINKLEGMTYEAYLGDTKMTNITVSFDKNNSKFTIKGAGIPTVKTWTNQVIKIKIYGENIVDGGITLDAMTIDQISADDIEIKQLKIINNVETDIDWTMAAVDDTGERTFKLKFNCPTPIPEGTSISTNDVGTISPFDVDNQTAILKVKKGWGEQPVNITIGSVTKEGVLTVPAIDADDITISSSPAAWASTTTNNEYTLTVGVKGAVTLEASDFSVSNATISTTWNASTSTLKIKPVDQSWTTDQDVVVTVHNVVTPKILTVQRRELADGDITLGTPTKKDSDNRFEMTLTLNNGVTKDILASVSATNATTNEQISNDSNDNNSKIRFGYNTTKVYFPYSKIPAKLWNQQQLINLTITASNGSSITKASVLTVEAIAADDITVQFVNNGAPENITSNTWNSVTADANGEKVFPLKITAPTALPQDCVVKYGEQTLSFDANDTTNSIVLLPLKQKVISQTVSLTINGVTKNNVMTVPARNLADGDITVSTATWGTTPYELTISYFNGASKNNISSIAADNGVTATLDTNKTKVTLTNVSQGWTRKDIKLKLNGSIDLGVVLTVPAKVPANCITVTPTSPATWASGTTSVTFTVTSSDSSLSITKVLYDETELTKSSNNAYTITAAEGQTIAEDVTITIKTKHDDVETDVTKSIFPISVNQNRFFGRSISINGTQQVYTFAETPKSVAAMQTRIIELPAVVQKAWESFSEEKAEVAAALAPASQVVEPKKSSKKTSKKAAKKAAKKVAKKAAEAVAETVTETAATLEVTELPAELLEEPVADDQLAMILPKTSNTEEVVEVEATLQTAQPETVMPAEDTSSEKHSSAAIWVVLIAVLASVCGLIFIKRRKVSA